MLGVVEEEGDPGVGVGVGTMAHCVLWSHCHSWTLGFPFLSITRPLGWTSVKINGRGIQSSASGPSVLARPAVDSGRVADVARPRPVSLPSQEGSRREHLLTGMCGQRSTQVW